MPMQQEATMGEVIFASPSDHGMWFITYHRNKAIITITITVVKQAMKAEKQTFS
jgi:hypothetical protein